MLDGNSVCDQSCDIDKFDVVYRKTTSYHCPRFVKVKRTLDEILPPENLLCRSIQGKLRKAGRTKNRAQLE